ncbi:hypothetical protein [Marisediminitalea sp.]|uniref:hypothetical protein n=1 Tax=Marisediminitalea sp. TaxID=2662268 RepID=UPI003513E895
MNVGTDSDLELRYDYLPNRSNPAAVFDTMAKYLKGYDDLGKLLAEAVGHKDEFTFQLVSVEHGSIKSKLGAAQGRLTSFVREAIFNSAVQLHNDLTGVKETSSEEDVLTLAQNLEMSLSNIIGEPSNMPPVVDPKKLVDVLQSLSSANDGVLDGETLQVSSLRKRSNINTKWRFTGDAKDMFSGRVSRYKGELQIRVKMPVNYGTQAWSVTTVKNEQTFPAKVQNEDWLKRYQEVEIAPISAKDVVTALVEYDIYKSATGTEIRNAKILNVISIDRFKGGQNDFFDD